MMRLTSIARSLDVPAVGAFALYLALSIVFFGRGLLGHFSDVYFGVGVDPGLMMWSLVWWPHAIAGGLNLFRTTAIWAPSGYNLAWATGIPLASMLASPLTFTLGPVETYNLLWLLSSPINALCAFVLCRYLTGDYAASLLGGYIFGFSAYVLGQLICGHLHMTLVFSLPLAVYLVLRRLHEQIAQGKFIFLLSLTLVAQFLLSVEVFATMTMLGAFALLMAWSSGLIPSAEKTSELIKSIVCACVMVAILISPYLYYFFFYNLNIAPHYIPAVFGANPLNFVVPTPVNQLGRISLFRSISAGFVSGWTVEAGAYVSLPLILVIVLYVRRHLADAMGRLLTYCLAVSVILALGPVLHISLWSHSLEIVLPWWLLVKLPLLENVITGRIAVYMFLAVSVMAACYCARDVPTPAGKAALAAAVILFTLPNLSAAYWVRPVDTPAFVRSGQYRRYLSPNEIVLILPYAFTGNAMMWQAQTHMYFKMAEGILPYPDPSAFRRWPIFPSLIQRAYLPDAAAQFRAFLAAHDIQTIVVLDDVLPIWRGLLTSLGVQPSKVDGVWVYRLPKEATPDVETMWRSLRGSFDVGRLTALIAAAQKYLAQGGTSDSLTMLKAEDLQLIPGESLVGPPQLIIPGLPESSNSKADPRLLDGVWLGKATNGLVSIGAEVWYAAATPLIEQLRGVASGIYYPYPDKLADGAHPGEPSGWLLMTFTPEQLARANELLTIAATRAQPDNRARGGVGPVAR